MDPQLIDDFNQASQRYQNLVKERYLITKHTHTSYKDTADLTPLERKLIFGFITEELQKRKDAYDKLLDHNRRK